MKTMEIFALVMAAIFVSFLGFAVENLWLSVTQGYMDNRNMCLPFLIGYGIAMLLILWLFGTPKRLCFGGKIILGKSKTVSRLIYFAGVMVCICIGEILLGTFVEKTCHFCWWDYTKIPLHITRYTSIPTSMMFSTGVTVFMDRCLEPIYNFFLTWGDRQLRNTVIVMTVFLTADFLYNARQMYRTQGMIQRWRIDTTENRVYKKLHA